MADIALLVIIIAVWVALNRWILPICGVST